MGSVMRGPVGFGYLLMVCLSVVGICYGQDSRQILDATGVKGGLIIHIDCADGRLYISLEDGTIACFNG